MAETYKVIIESKDGVGNEQLDSETVETPNGELLEIKEDSGTTPKKKNKKTTPPKPLTAGLGAYVAKQAFSFVNSNITQWTGSEQATRSIQAGTKALGYATALAVNPVLGGASILFDVGTSFYTYNQDMFFRNLEADALRERSGRQIFGQGGRNNNFRR
jgi:hypothetical protein